jgi:hypothetical protein
MNKAKQDEINKLLDGYNSKDGTYTSKVYSKRMSNIPKLLLRLGKEVEAEDRKCIIDKLNQI